MNFIHYNLIIILPFCQFPLNFYYVLLLNACIPHLCSTAFTVGKNVTYNIIDFKYATYSRRCFSINKWISIEFISFWVYAFRIVFIESLFQHSQISYKTGLLRLKKLFQFFKQICFCSSNTNEGLYVALFIWIILGADDFDVTFFCGILKRNT